MLKFWHVVWNVTCSFTESVLQKFSKSGIRFVINRVIWYVFKISFLRDLSKYHHVLNLKYKFEMLEFIGLECTFFTLVLRNHLLHTEWNHDLDVCCGVGWGLPYFNLPDGAGCLVAKRAGWHRKCWRAPV